MEPWLSFIINVVSPIVLLVVIYFIGGAIEKKHYKNIRARERKHRNLPAITMNVTTNKYVSFKAKSIEVGKEGTKERAMRNKQLYQ